MFLILSFVKIGVLVEGIHKMGDRQTIDALKMGYQRELNRYSRSQGIITPLKNLKRGVSEKENQTMAENPVEEHPRTLLVMRGASVEVLARVENHQLGHIKVWIEEPGHPPSLIDNGDFEVHTRLGLGANLIGKLLLIRTNATDVVPQTNLIQFSGRKI